MTNTTQQMQASLQLAEQINDEFLTCKICFEHYRDPKCLSCLHTFCEECIDQHINAQRSYKYSDYREFSCPICRKKTVIPSGGVRKLNDNFLISSLNELLTSKRLSKIPICDICKLVSQREVDATCKCVECQKSMCRSCVATHQQMKVTNMHSVYELDIEKDIMCKQHPNEQVRFYCETCEMCVCLACTYTSEHREHDLVDFRQGISRHKDVIEEQLLRCHIKMSAIRHRLELVRKCEAHMQAAQSEIHQIALNFIEAIREKEQALLNDLTRFYGAATSDFVKKRDEFETLLDQLKSTCNLTEMVVKGKDIEMLLLKKQLCEKFNEFELVELEPVPDNINKKVLFVPGSVDLGYITEMSPSMEKKATATNTTVSENEDSDKENEEDVEEGEYQDQDQEQDEDESKKEEEEKQQEQRLVDSETQTTTTTTTTSSEEDKSTQTMPVQVVDADATAPHLNMNTLMMRSTTPTLSLSQQSSLDECESTSSSSSMSAPGAAATATSSSAQSTNNGGPVDRNKLSRRVRRHVKPGCSIAVMPSNEIIIVDPESNCVTVLDRRGKFRYGMSNSTKPCTETGHQLPSAVQFGHNTATATGTSGGGGGPSRLERAVRIHTPQGTLIVKLENEQIIEQPNVALAIHAYDRMAAENI